MTPSRMVQELRRRSLRPATRPGPELISLAAGDPDFATPEHISQALADALAAGATHYAQPQGDPDLRAALAGQMSDVAGRPFSASQVAVTHGSSGALAAIIFGLVDPGTRVVVPEPTYSLYADLTWMAGGEVTFVRHQPDLHFDLDGIEEAAPGARMVIICNPCNPTGAVYTQDELEDLADIAEEHDLLVVVDEPYDHIVFDGADFVSSLEIPRLADRLVYVNTFSKTYAMTGWRIGWVAGPQQVVDAATAMHRAFNGPLNSAVQRAALAAVTEPTDAPERMRREYQARRDIVSRMVAGVPGLDLVEPEGSFYAFIRYGSLEPEVPAVDAVARALEQGVAVRPGSEFGPGGEGCVRVAFSTGRERLIEGMERLLGILEEIAEPEA
ncbi:MAG TPA: aminotransferase class I/II-fold pyridoxal phosphate-dependent enzyme [Candidatus Dormibacteraeota bacterium]|nr:aminotransferase class I/II-fold pyridoxal phosphate-dependent enzyme [Candidatus Dormibacteraeota bacterium]